MTSSHELFRDLMGRGRHSKRRIHDSGDPERRDASHFDRARAWVPGRIGCAVLAAGGSRRLGSAKQLVTLHGVPLVRRISQVVVACRFGACAVVVGCRAAEVSAALAELPLTLLPNPGWEEGIASSIREAARWAHEQRLSGLALVTCDQWRLSRSHLGRLRTVIREPQDLAGSQYGAVLGVPAVFGHAWLPALAALSGDRGAGLVLASSPRVQRIPWAPGADDLDTEADLARARARLEGSSR